MWMVVTAYGSTGSHEWPVLTPEMDFFTLLLPLDLLNVSIHTQLLP